MRGSSKSHLQQGLFAPAATTQICVLRGSLLASVQCQQSQSQANFWKFMLASALYASWRECYIRNGITSRLPLHRGLLLLPLGGQRRSSSSEQFWASVSRKVGRWDLSWYRSTELFLPGRLNSRNAVRTCSNQFCTSQVGTACISKPSFMLLRSNQPLSRTKLVQAALQPWFSSALLLFLHCHYICDTGNMAGNLRDVRVASLCKTGL